MESKLRNVSIDVLKSCIHSFYSDVVDASKGTMLAKEFIHRKTLKPVIDPKGWWASEKYDGMRALWTGNKLVSRNNKPIAAPKWFLKWLPRGVPLDGELLIDRAKFQELISVVRKKVPIDSEWKKVKYFVFDVPLNLPFEERMKIMNKIIAQQCKYKRCPLIPTENIKIKSSNLNYKNFNHL